MKLVPNQNAHYDIGLNLSITEPDNVCTLIKYIFYVGYVAIYDAPKKYVILSRIG